MQVRDRKTLLALLESVNERNRAYYQKFGKWETPQIKVFWLEVNKPYRAQALGKIGANLLDRELYEWQPTEEHVYWIDAADERIWQVFTFSSTADARKHLRPLHLEVRGVDRLWFPETFLDKIRTSMGFDDRGFGLRFENLLSEQDDRPFFSAKLWLSHVQGTAGVSEAKRRFLEAGRDAFALSTVRFGRRVARDDAGLSGQLYELYHDGHLTVTTCDDTQDLLHLLSSIRSRYKDEIIELERAREHRPEIIEVDFDEEVSSDALGALVESGGTNLRLWLHGYERDGDLKRYNGVDLHTGDFLHLDAGGDYSYLSADRKACMNMAPRFGTLAARYLSSKAKIYHDGVELFA